ncbi:MAG TPA: Ig-like domain repeat protein, partial [Mycobacteriales bacterium]|nr:Ig-like domain repeat protein [Mycobacteriales bacterium]
DALNASSNYGQDVFLAAPGTGIYTTTAGGGYASVTGTSAAAAEVAGAAALLRASSVGASNGVIVNRLAESADAAGTVSQTGNGRLNLARAVSDTSSTSVEPAGAAPIGGGGPFVGPYVAAGAVNGGSLVIREHTCATAQSSFTSGTTVCAHASVTIGGGGSANWTVLWFAPGVDSTAGPAAHFASFTDSTATATHDDTFAPTTAGTWKVVICKTGDTSKCSGGNTIASATFVVTADTSTSVSSSVNPSKFGQSVTFTATVTSSGPGTPTGTVTFKDGATTLGTGTLSGGVASFSTSTLSVGSHTINVDYAGDGNFNTSSGSTSQTVGKSDTSTSVSS